MSKTRIIASVCSLDVPEIRSLLDGQPSLLEVTDRQGRNLLLLACSASCQALRVSENVSATVVSLLLDRGIDVNSTLPQDGYPCNSVWFAVARGRNPTWVKLLIQRSATPTGLFAAAFDPDWLRYLVAQGASPDLADRHGDSPRMQAARKRDKRFADALV